MVTRDFDAAMRARGGRPEFTIGGEKFTARARLPWQTFHSLFAEDEDPETVDPRERTIAFLRRAIVRADRERFLALLTKDDEDDDDDEHVVTPEQVNELMEWLMEHYTGKRLDSDSSSSAGAASTGPSPNVVSLSSRAQAG